MDLSSLPPLRLFQTVGVEEGMSFFKTAGPNDHLLMQAPTGAGKTPIILTLKSQLGFKYYVTSPSDDILAGFAKKAKLRPTKSVMEAHGLFTPMRLRNLLINGEIPPPLGLLVDESHHSESDTYKLIDTLCNYCPSIGFTATPFRGTPRSTVEFRKYWGEPLVLISMANAVKEGYISFPSFTVIPLLDDDVIEVTNGEFTLTSTEEQLGDIIGRTLGEMTRMFGGDVPDRPTMIAVPGKYSAELYAAEMNKAGIPAVCVTGDTPKGEREIAYRRCLNNEAVLVQIRVVGEGVDLPIRRLIDLAPTLSPVKWLQLLGRIERPINDGEAPPEYICTNRNLLRHAYLLEGLLPPQIYSDAEAAFVTPSERNTVRALGFEGLGRFEQINIPLHNGTNGTMVCITKQDGPVATQYAAIASPLHSDVLYATRLRIRDSNGSAKERWVQIAELPDIPRGFATIPDYPLTPKMRGWWNRSARFYGLDAEAKVSSRMFNVLPILYDCKFRFR